MVVMGCNADDAAEYPDCRPAFLRAFESVAHLGSKHLAQNFEIYTPLIAMNKVQIVGQSRKRDLPIELSFSCYRPKGDTSCGKCLACERRAIALAFAEWDPRKRPDFDAGAK